MAPRALIVEDDPAQRRILEEMVKRIGLVPQSAESGLRALDILAGPQRHRVSSSSFSTW